MKITEELIREYQNYSLEEIEISIGSLILCENSVGVASVDINKSKEAFEKYFNRIKKDIFEIICVNSDLKSLLNNDRTTSVLMLIDMLTGATEIVPPVWIALYIIQKGLIKFCELEELNE